MKKNIFALSLLVVCAMIATAFAQDTPQKQASKRGTFNVVSVNAKDSTIDVKDSSGATQTFKVAATSKMTKEGKDIALADLKAGDAVSVEYTDEGGTMTVKSLSVSPGKTKP
jgi:hypothetical protein